jgi:hypothetical protein
MECEVEARSALRGDCGGAAPRSLIFLLTGQARVTPRVRLLIATAARKARMCDAIMRIAMLLL